MAQTPDSNIPDTQRDDQVPYNEQQEREHAGLEGASVYGTDDYAGTLGGSVERVRSDVLPEDYTDTAQAFDEYYDEDDDSISSDELDPSPLS